MGVLDSHRSFLGFANKSTIPTSLAFEVTMQGSTGVHITLPMGGTNNCDITTSYGEEILGFTGVNPVITPTITGEFTVSISGVMTDIMFYNSSADDSLISVDSLGGTGLLTLQNSFRSCPNLMSINGKDSDLSSCLSVNAMGASCASLTSVNLENAKMDVCTTFLAMTSGSPVTNICFRNVYAPQATNTDLSLRLNTVIETLDFSGADFSSSTESWYERYRGCTSLTDMNMSGLKIPNVTSLARAVLLCSSLLTIDISNIDARNATDFSLFADRSTSLTTLITSGANLSSVTNMSRAFYGCVPLISAVDPDLFWNNSTVTTYSLCFTNDINIANYADIPAAWK